MSLNLRDDYWQRILGYLRNDRHGAALSSLRDRDRDLESQINGNIQGNTTLSTKGLLDLVVEEHRACTVEKLGITLATGVSTAVNYNTAAKRDVYGMHVIGSGHVLVPSAGWYLITHRVEYATNSTGDRYLATNFISAGVQRNDQTSPAIAAFSHRLSTSTLEYLSASTTITSQVYQNSGGNLNTNARMSVYKLGVTE